MVVLELQCILLSRFRMFDLKMSTSKTGRKIFRDRKSANLVIHFVSYLTWKSPRVLIWIWLNILLFKKYNVNKITRSWSALNKSRMAQNVSLGADVLSPNSQICPSDINRILLAIYFRFAMVRVSALTMVPSYQNNA